MEVFRDSVAQLKTAERSCRGKPRNENHGSWGVANSRRRRLVSSGDSLPSRRRLDRPDKFEPKQSLTPAQEQSFGSAISSWLENE